MDAKLQIAESVLPGHPDRLADGVAEALVDQAVAGTPNALVGVEVAVHRSIVYVTGRIAAGRVNVSPSQARAYVRKVVNSVYGKAGYENGWKLTPRVAIDLDWSWLGSTERDIRGVSDDQNIVVGHASGSAATGWLPPEAFVARRMRDALARVREANDSRLGPDGKVLVAFDEEPGGRHRWRRLNVAVQHAEGVGYEELHRLLLPALEAEVREIDAAVPGLAASWLPDLVRVNGAGDFSCGGPHGDNGLSGKKLVVDHYGPGVPIGGGALCGKDPHKVDRIGALRARQIAVRLARAGAGRSVTTWLGWLPGRAAPDFLHADVDGKRWDERRIAAAIPVPDLTIEGSFVELELVGVNWQAVAREGYFGLGRAWER